jgi:hypothetical protein
MKKKPKQCPPPPPPQNLKIYFLEKKKFLPLQEFANNGELK